MKAHEIMTTDVITVTPSTSVKDVAQLLIKNRISGVPVVDGEGHVLGIISESDLLHRAETATEHKRKWWLELFTGTDALAREYVKTHGLTAQDIMSRVVVSVHENADLAQVADILDTHRIRRVVVLRDGRLVGLVSRSDLVRAFTSIDVSETAERSEDGAIQKAVLNEIQAQDWLKSAGISVAVRNGVVELWGVVDSEDEREALRLIAQNVKGVRQVDNHVKLHPSLGYPIVTHTH